MSFSTPVSDTHQRFAKRTSGTDLNIRDNTPLLNLAGGMHESVDLAAVLLARGADPNVVDYHGGTPLFHVAERFHIDFLLGRGARATRRRRKGSSDKAPI